MYVCERFTEPSCHQSGPISACVGLYRLLYISLYSFQSPESTRYKSRAEDRPGYTILCTLAKEVQVWGHLTTFDRKICFWIEQFALFSLLNTFIFQYLSKPRRRSRNCTQLASILGRCIAKTSRYGRFAVRSPASLHDFGLVHCTRAGDPILLRRKEGTFRAAM